MERWCPHVQMGRGEGTFRKECLEMGQRSSDDNTDESERTLSTVSAPTENESKVIGFAESLK